MPDSSVGKQITWLLNAFNTSTPLTQEEIAEHFGPTASVVLTPPDFDSIRAGQPWTTVKYKEATPTAQFPSPAPPAVRSTSTSSSTATG
ncbi:Cpe/LpqF family protein [Rhodococcus sp. 3Y1]